MVNLVVVTCLTLVGTLDRDVKTKKTYWYTRSEAQKSSRLDIPAVWKKQFADKQITCGEYYDSVA